MIAAEIFLGDLQERLTAAKDELSDMADASPGKTESARLAGKAEGVGLALSYLDEYFRG